MIFLLDTNVCIEVLRQRTQRVVERLKALPLQSVRLCSIVKAELLFSASRSAKPAANLAQVAAFTEPFISLPFDDAAAHRYAIIRTEAENRGQPIGPYDMMIAAIAIVHEATLVTHNLAEFSRINGLQLDDWLR